jgi:plastocyanin domain-containing protein
MFQKNILWATVTALGLSLGTVSATTPTHSSGENNIHPIEQPLGVKVAVTMGGVALIALELWWFVLSKSPAQTHRKED